MPDDHRGNGRGDKRGTGDRRARGPPPWANNNLPDTAHRGQSIEASEVEDGDVKVGCPKCKRLITVKRIIEENECKCGHALDLILIEGDNARREG